MAGTAAHLVDCVLPASPVRQYVLAFPYELSGLAATRPDVLCLDGVYVEAEAEAKDGKLRFEAAPAPSREELQETLEYVYARVLKWLARRGLSREADASNEAPSYSASEAMTLAGMQRGTLETAKDTGERAAPELAEPPHRLTDAAVHERFNLHASVRVPAHDDLARERLCRYLARPAFSLARFGVRRDGLVVYRVKNACRGRIKQRVMSPVECLARLAAMVPPPRYPLLRLHGVLAPRHPWRARVVPRPPESHAECTKDEVAFPGRPLHFAIAPSAISVRLGSSANRARRPSCSHRTRSAFATGRASSAASSTPPHHASPGRSSYAAPSTSTSSTA